MGIEDFSDRELRAELAARKTVENARVQEALDKRFPCPECGDGVQSWEENAVEEYRFAPRDSEGRAMLYAPYESELGTTHGVRYETKIVCRSGHVWYAPDRIEWFDKPQTGSSLLPH